MNISTREAYPPPPPEKKYYFLINRKLGMPSYNHHLTRISAGVHYNSRRGD